MPSPSGNAPEDYKTRLILMYRGAWTHLRLYGLEAHDLALFEAGTKS